MSVCARPSTSGRLTAYGIIRASYAPLERNAKLSFRQGTGSPFYFFFSSSSLLNPTISGGVRREIFSSYATGTTATVRTG